MIKLLKKLHLFGTYKRFCAFLINHVFVGMFGVSNRIKCALLRSMGHKVGTGTTIVSPVYIIGQAEIGNNCWINRGFTVHGNGTVRIGNNCDIAPDVSFLTGGHTIGGRDRRAGPGEIYEIRVQDGCWIGSRATILGNTCIGASSIVAACACVARDVPANTLVGGVPAKTIRRLEDEAPESTEA